MTYYFITYFYNPDERGCTSIRVSVQQSDPLLLENRGFFALIPAWIHNYIIKCMMKLLIHIQTSMVLKGISAKICNKISSFSLFYMHMTSN